MKAILLALLTSILVSMGLTPEAVKNLPPTHELLVRARSCADDVIEVVGAELGEKDRKIWAPVVLVWAMHESGCQADPQGDNDKGASCGVLQVQTPQKWLDGATCSKVRADRKLGLRVGLRVMLMKARECGTVGAGMSAYSSNGQCPPKGFILHTAKKRLVLVGVDPATVWPSAA